MPELGETQDPAQLISGKPEAIEDNARVLRARADSADDAAQGLLAVDTGSWTGPAAQAFHDKFSYEPRKWFAATDALDSAADALDDYAGTLRWAQSQAAEAIAAWNRGQEATQQAQAAHDQAATQAVAANQPAPPAFIDPGEAGRQAARDMLNRARTQLSEAGDNAAAILRGAMDTAPQESSWLSDLGHTLANAGADVVNGLASFGNAALNHPLDVLAAAGGLGLTTISAAGFGGGTVLDATGVGAVAGVPVQAVSAAGMASGVGITTAAMADLGQHASGDDNVEVIKKSGDTGPEPTATPKPAEGLADQFKDGPPKASDLERYAESQGWTRAQTPTGPPKYVDENGVDRMIIKQGSARTPGSEGPHVEMKNEHGQRIDPQGNPVSKRSAGNHTEINWDL